MEGMQQNKIRNSFETLEYDNSVSDWVLLLNNSI